MNTFVPKLSVIAISLAIASSSFAQEKAEPLYDIDGKELPMHPTHIYNEKTDTYATSMTQVENQEGVIFLGDDEITLSLDENGNFNTKAIPYAYPYPPRAGWYALNYSPLSIMDVFYYNGITYPGTTWSIDGCGRITTPYTVKIDIDGTIERQYSTNIFGIPFTRHMGVDSIQYCGTNVQRISKGNNNTISPGTYNLTFTQGAKIAKGSVEVPACIEGTAFLQLYASRNAAVTDFFMTTNKSDHDESINNPQLGFVRQNTVAKVVPHPHGPNSAVFMRFYKYLPQTDHFYTVDSSEESYVISNGWTRERDEGYIYTKALPGTVPLHRLNKLYPSDPLGDLEHFYTTSDSEKDNYVANGWWYDGVKGYVCKY